MKGPRCGGRVRLRLQLARVYVTLADQSTARHLLTEIDDVLTHRPDLGAPWSARCQHCACCSPHRCTSPSRRATPHACGAPPAPLYLQTHLNFREIGERLFLSRNTVATEVGSIYRKLGVSSPSAAVERATTVGFLGG
ncbi:MAG TPA: LuxR C-terminal-related transcriptional regulator [Microlunatus sp.]